MLVGGHGCTSGTESFLQPSGRCRTCSGMRERACVCLVLGPGFPSAPGYGCSTALRPWAGWLAAAIYVTFSVIVSSSASKSLL